MGSPMYKNNYINDIQKILDAGERAGLNEPETITIHSTYSESQDILVREVNRLKETIKALEDTYNNALINILKRTIHQNKLEDSADRAFRFMGGLCMRDFPISTQREYELVFSELKQALISCNHKKGGRDK